MTDYPRPGDRVKITLEGEVQEVDLFQRHITLVGVYSKVPTPPGSVEVRERTYKPGTVALGVGSPAYSPMARTSEGKWLNLDAGGHETTFSDRDISYHVAKGELSIHEPSA